MSAIKKLLNNSWQGIQKLRPSAQGMLRPSAQGTRSNSLRFTPELTVLEGREVPSASISGVVFSDINNNGVIDPGEVGVGGAKVTVSWIDNSGKLNSQSQNTQANGSFTFNNLTAATYSITEQLPGGYFNGEGVPGSSGGTGGVGTISGVTLGSSTAATGYNLGALPQSAGWSAIQQNFNPAVITAGDTIWFDAGLKVGGLPPGATSAAIDVTGQTISFTAGGQNYSYNLPDSEIDLSSSTTTASMSYDAVENEWDVDLPLNYGGNAFMGGGMVPVTVNLPGNISNVTWTGNFSGDTSGLNVNWQWGAAVYSSLGTDYNQINVKPLDGPEPVTAYNNGDHAGTPEAFKSNVVNGATGNGGNNWTGNLSGGKGVTPTFINNNAGAVLYPFTSSNPLTSIAFNESTVLAAAKLDTTNGTFDLWYSDEHAMTLGVSQVNVVTKSGTQTTNYALASLTSNPGSAVNPAIGATATSGDQAGVDTSGRPMAPELFITDITNNPTSLAGDWQYGGTGYAPNAVFGTWKGAVKTVNYTTSTPTVTVTCLSDPAQNSWNLGAGSDAPPSGLHNEGYGTEVRWNLDALYQQGILLPGHTYRFYVMVHDGDQNKTGGDAGQAAYNYTYPGPSSNSLVTSLSGTVFSDNNGTGVFGAGDSGLPTMTVTLTGTDANGKQVFLQTTTDANGNYTFTGLTASDANGYTLTVTPSGAYMNGQATPGTVNGNTDGTSPQFGVISGITLSTGNQGTNYNFAEELAD